MRHANAVAPSVLSDAPSYSRMTTPLVPSATPQPRRRRWRRSLITGLILLSCTSYCWWHWPRGEARFAGKWAVSSTRDGPPQYYISLQRNGVRRDYEIDGSARNY